MEAPILSTPYARQAKSFTPVAVRGVVFAKTNVPNLYQHRNGIYYSRVTLDDQRQFHSLSTKLKSVADGELKNTREKVLKNAKMRLS